MPYKSEADRKGNFLFKKEVRINEYRKRKLKFYRGMGLEPLDVNDSNSELECLHCGKITPRSCAHMFRHYEGCRMIKHLPVEIKKWRRTTKVYVGICKSRHIFGKDGYCIKEGCTRHKDDADNARRNNVAAIAARRRLETISS